MGPSEPRRAGRTLAKYVLLQLPGLVAVVAGLAALVHWFDMLPWLAGLLLGLWLLKDLALYPYLRVAYEAADPDVTAALVGRQAVVRERLHPEGWVLVGSELWRAELARGSDPVETGARVRVRAVRGFVLEVEPA